MGKLIKDEFTDLSKKVSRQRIWQIRKAREGVCIICGGRRFTKNHCFEHAKKFVLWRKKKYKTKTHYKPIGAYEPYGPREKNVSKKNKK